MISHIALRIKEGPKGPLHINSMPLQAAEAFQQLIQAMIELARNSPNPSKINVVVKEGSLETGLVGEDVEEIAQEFLRINEGNSTNDKSIKIWSNIRKVYREQDFKFEAAMLSGDNWVTLTDKVQSARPFKKKTTEKKYKSPVVFFEGELTESGGKSRPNFHIDTNWGEKIVWCSRQDVLNSKDFQYKDIAVIAYKKSESENSNHIIRVYHPEDELYLSHKNFFEEKISNQTEIAALTAIHRLYATNLKEGNFEYIRELNRIFATPAESMSTLKTILVIAKDFHQHPKIKKSLADVEEAYNKLKNRKLVYARKEGQW
jgi:hypothetical protein